MPQITFRQYLEERYGPNINENFRFLGKVYKKLAKTKNDITFLHKCKQFDIIPKFLRLKITFTSAKATRILEKASKSLIRERIQFLLTRNEAILIDIHKIENNIRNLMSEEDFQHMCGSILYVYNAEFLLNKNRQRGKFTNLITEKQTIELNRINNNPLISKTVINLSTRDLNISDKLILAKGLNFAITPSNVPKFDIITAIEKTAQELPIDEGNEYRIRSKIILEKQFRIKDNITTEEKQSISSLKNDTTIKILPADKGNATVILDINTYNSKIINIINEGPYLKLNKNPTKTIEREVYNTLFKHKNEFNPSERKFLTPHYSKPPHFYGLPKVHKHDIPLRPIVSSINSPCHRLAKYLLKIINPLCGNTDSYIKNSKYFLDKLKEINIQNHHIMVSFDVISLFTNVPVDKTLNIVKNKLENDITLTQRTKLSINTIMELITLCIKTTYFQLENDFYKQNFGMAMGSPLSPVLSNIFMEHFEDNYIQNLEYKPIVWWRYVDDIFVIWPHDIETLNNFLERINNIEPTIKFTLELENDNELPFLDILIKKSSNTLMTSVYRKKTHTNRYLNFLSNQSINVKKGVIKCLYDRAKIISSNNDILNEEKEFIKTVLCQNNYPEEFIDNTISKIESNVNSPRQQIEYKYITSIPYIQGLSEKLRRVGDKFKIRTVFQTANTLRTILTKTKPNNDEQNSKNCIYSIPCECGKQYIGETSRPLDVRKNEHQGYFRKNEIEKSQICVHAWESGHRIDWNNTKILTKEQDNKKRKIKESAFILLNRETCLSNCSVDISRTWLSMLERNLR